MQKFGLKQLGFSEWIEIQALASKGKSKANDILLRSLKAKFEWVKAQSGKLGLPPPPKLTAVGLSATKKKRKEPLRLSKKGLVITEPESRIFYYNGNYDLVFQRENDFHLASTAQLIRKLGYIQRTSPEAEEMIKTSSARHTTLTTSPHLVQHLEHSFFSPRRWVLSDGFTHWKEIVSGVHDVTWWVYRSHSGWTSTGAATSLVSLATWSRASTLDNIGVTQSGLKYITDYNNFGRVRDSLMGAGHLRMTCAKQLSLHVAHLSPHVSDDSESLYHMVWAFGKKISLSEVLLYSNNAAFERRVSMYLVLLCLYGVLMQLVAVSVMCM
ncbi:hypothetical protein Tco_0195914 [Tanacetum coccineum]